MQQTDYLCFSHSLYAWDHWRWLQAMLRSQNDMLQTDLYIQFPASLNWLRTLQIAGISDVACKTFWRRWHNLMRPSYTVDVMRSLPALLPWLLRSFVEFCTWYPASDDCICIILKSCSFFSNVCLFRIWNNGSVSDVMFIVSTSNIRQRRYLLKPKMRKS